MYSLICTENPVRSHTHNVLELTGWSRVYNTDSSVNLQAVLVSLEVNRVAHPQEDKDFLEVGYSYHSHQVGSRVYNADFFVDLQGE